MQQGVRVLHKRCSGRASIRISGIVVFWGSFMVVASLPKTVVTPKYMNATSHSRCRSQVHMEMLKGIKKIV